MNNELNNYKTLGEYVTETLKNYFNNLDGQLTANLYDMVISEVERPLIEAVLTYTNHNQTVTANILGLSRGTLRKKMQQYNLFS